MGDPMRRFWMFAVLAAAAATQWPAIGQCRLCDSPTTLPDAPLNSAQVKLEIETSLDFDRLILLGQGEGSALLRPDGTASAQGMIAEVGPRAMVGSAVVHGQPGRAVRIELPAQIVLYSTAGARIDFDEVVSDLPAMPRLDSSGKLRFRFGGRLRISGDAEGEYRGDLPITVEYL